MLVIGGAFAVFLALSGSGRTLTGGATTVPSTVRTTPPRAAADTAAALRASAPVRIIIPSLRVDAPVMRLGRGDDGSIQVPPLANHNLAGWYDRSVTPGQDGTSIILGHVDSFTGRSVFYNIKDLTHGRYADLTLDTSSNPEARLNAIRSTKVWGTMCFVGEGGDVTIDVSPHLLRRQMTLIASWTFSTVIQAECAQFCIERKVDVDKLFTHRWTLDQAEEAYKLFDKQSDGKGVFLM